MKRIFLIMIMIMMVLPVAAGTYAAIPQEFGDGCGTLEITMRAGTTAFSHEMYLERIVDDKSFTVGLVEKDVFDTFKIDGGKTIYFPSSGIYSERIAPGNYAITLLDGNGGQKERAFVRIDQGYLSRVMFIGHAVSQDEGKIEPVVECKPLLITAGDLYRVGFLAWFRVDVVNQNPTGKTESWVTITDSQGHELFDFLLRADQEFMGYTFYFPAQRWHLGHNPLTVVVKDTVCTPWGIPQ